jgi:protein TonB
MNYKINTAQRRFSASFIASVSAHILLAVLLTVASADKPPPKRETPKVMDVVLLDENKKSSKKASKDAKTIANINAMGGDRKAQDRRTRKARAPMVGQQPKPKPTPPRQPKTPPTPTQQQQKTRMLAKRGTMPDERKPRKITRPVKKKKPIPPKKKQVPLSDLMPSTIAMAQLSQNVERERRMKQKMTRQADIPINTREAKYAPYAQTLVRALEEQWRPGHANYREFPEEARRSLIRLTIENNGDLGSGEILRPSPIPEINQSAVKAIQAAAPFKVLPSSWGLDRVSFYLTFEIVEDKFVFRPM